MWVNGRVLYDFVAEADTELTVFAGEMIEFEPDPDEWTLVRKSDGTQGYAPTAYIERLNDDDRTSIATAAATVVDPPRDTATDHGGSGIKQIQVSSPTMVLQPAIDAQPSTSSKSKSMIERKSPASSFDPSKKTPKSSSKLSTKNKNSKSSSRVLKKRSSRSSRRKASPLDEFCKISSINDVDPRELVDGLADADGSLHRLHKVAVECCAVRALSIPSAEKNLEISPLLFDRAFNAREVFNHISEKYRIGDQEVERVLKALALFHFLHPFEGGKKKDSAGFPLKGRLSFAKWVQDHAYILASAGQRSWYCPSPAGAEDFGGASSEYDDGEFVPAFPVMGDEKALHKRYSFVQPDAKKGSSSVVGRGTGGLVLLGRHAKTKEAVAIKQVPDVRFARNIPEEERGEKYDKKWSRKRLFFLREIAVCRMMQSLPHPNVVRTWDMYVSRANITIVMEMMPGKDLEVIFKQFHLKMREEDIRVIIMNVLLALHHLHSIGITHRDVKPANVLCCSETRFTQCKLCDFGVSSVAGTQGEDRMKVFGGSLPFVSPEMIKAENPYSCKNDLYGVGAMVYFLLFGEYHIKQPLENPKAVAMAIARNKWRWPASIVRFGSEVSNESRDFIEKCLAHEEDRMSAKEALFHPWITSGSRCSKKLIDEYLSITVDAEERMKRARRNAVIQSVGHALDEDRREMIEFKSKTAMSRGTTSVKLQVFTISGETFDIIVTSSMTGGDVLEFMARATNTKTAEHALIEMHKTEPSKVIDSSELMFFRMQGWIGSKHQLLYAPIPEDAMHSLHLIDNPPPDATKGSKGDAMDVPSSQQMVKEEIVPCEAIQEEPLVVKAAPIVVDDEWSMEPISVGGFSMMGDAPEDPFAMQEPAPNSASLADEFDALQMSGGMGGVDMAGLDDIDDMLTSWNE